LLAEEVVDTPLDRIIMVLVDKEAVASKRLLLMDVHILSREAHVIHLHSRESMNNMSLASASSQ